MQDSLSDPVSGGIRFTAVPGIPPNGGGGIFGFYNDTGETITRIDIDTLALTGLNPEIFGPPTFNCNADNPFFLQCGFSYNPDTGFLRISFFGVSPLRVDGPHGIPSCGEICLDTSFGHFAINLNDNFSRDGNSGGWNLPDFFPQDDGKEPGEDGPTRFVGHVNSPEPGTILLLSSALLGGLALRRRRR